MSRKQPVKTATIPLKDEYEGWNFLARTNPPVRVFGDVASGNFDRIVHGLSQIILGWNFVDEEGMELAAPTEQLIGDRPLDLVLAVSNAYAEEVSKIPSR